MEADQSKSNQGRKLHDQGRKKNRHIRRTARISTHQMQSLAFNFGTLIEAQNSLPEKSGIDLAEIIEQKNKLAEAWQRGRFLRNVRNLASVPVTMDEAARRLSLNGADDLRAILDNDREAGDTWHQTRYEAFIKIKLALVKTAFEGNQAAIRAVESFLRAEMDYKVGGPRRLRITDIANLTGQLRGTIHNWVSRYQLPLGPDKTIELKDFIRWFEVFTAEKAASKNGGKKDQSSRLHAMKAEQIEIELKRQRRELLSREEVMAGILHRYQLLINTMRQKAPQMAQLCQGQKPERVIEIITDCLGDICRELCHVPAEFYLPEAAAKAYQKVLEILKNDLNENQP